MTAARTTRQAGFTLTELMFVVVIIGVLAVMAFNLLTPTLDPDDVAENAASLMREAGRRASVGGVVRGDVVIALALAPKPPRTRLHVLPGASPRKIAVERLQEDPLPANTANWVQVQSMTVPSAVVVKGWRPTADLNGGVGPSVVLAATDEVIIQCYPNSSCDAATLYFDSTTGTATQARVVLMPLGGSPVMFESW